METAPLAVCLLPMRGAYVVYAEQFNRNLKILARDIAARYPEDATADRAKKRIMTVIDVDPLYVIDTVGPYLYAYRDQIFALNDPAAGARMEDFFLENSFDAELQASVVQETADLVSYVIPKLKERVRALPPEEKRQYKELVIALLDDYIEYLAEKTPLA